MGGGRSESHWVEGCQRLIWEIVLNMYLRRMDLSPIRQFAYIIDRRHCGMIGTVTLCDTAAETRTGVEGGDTPHSKEGWGDHQSSSNGALHEEVSVPCEDPNNKAAAGVPQHPSMQGSDRSMICHPFRERHARAWVDLVGEQVQCKCAPWTLAFQHSSPAPLPHVK